MIHFYIAKLEQELNELEKKTLESDFWDDTTTANSILDIDVLRIIRRLIRKV